MARLRKATGLLLLIGFSLLLLNISSSSYRIRQGLEESSQGWASVSKRLQLKKDMDLWGQKLSPSKDCWSKAVTKKIQKPWGYVVVRCSRGPHNHRAEIAAAVVVALNLGATLVLPSIRDVAKEPSSNFAQLYKVQHFINSLEGIVRVVGRIPNTFHDNYTLSNVPLLISKDFIEDFVRPLFKKHAVIILGNFTRNNMTDEMKDMQMETVRCLISNRALQFNIQVEKLGSRVVERMREAAASDGGRFIALDVRMDLFANKSCLGGRYSGVPPQSVCLKPVTVVSALRSLGFAAETAIYVTQSPWVSSLDVFLEKYPNTHTKDYSLPLNEDKQFYFSGKTQIELAVDFYVCMHSDMFMYAVPSSFAKVVTEERVLAGDTQILTPALLLESLDDQAF